MKDKITIVLDRETMACKIEVEGEDGAAVPMLSALAMIEEAKRHFLFQREMSMLQQVQNKPQIAYTLKGNGKSLHI
jgi:hypothetical protein